jgi:hypothetical protein
MGHLTEALYLTCVAWVNATGQGPVAITLPANIHAALAAELRQWDPAQPLRLVYRMPITPLYPTTEGDIPKDVTFVTDEIRIGDHFTWSGPTGPVEVWADKWDI